MDQDEAVRWLAETHGSYLVAFATRLTGNRESGADLVQEALLATLKAVRRGGRDIENVRAYVLTAITRTYLRSSQRSARTAPELTAQWPDSWQVDPANEVAETDAVLKALDKLAPSQRTVLVLRYLCDMSDMSIAEITAMPLSTIRSHAARGLASFRLHYGHQETHESGRSHDGQAERIR